MGSPELPNEPEHIRSINDVPVANFESNTSDDSDIDEENIYDGYELIPMVESADPDDDMDNNSEDDELTNLPNILNRVDPIERQIWNEPRPREDKLDNINAEQVRCSEVRLFCASYIWNMFNRSCQLWLA